MINENHRLRIIRRSMGLNDHPPIPIENPRDQIRAEFQRWNKIQRIICCVAVFVLVAIFVTVLCTGQ